MKILFLSFFSWLFVSTINWETDFEKAKQIAQTENKLIVLNFSGSDWCGPCIRMHKEIFESDVFATFAGDHLVLLNADFPRLKKNQLSKEQQKKNDLLADKYNSEGSFPSTLLLDANGKILKKWEGFPSISAEEFTNQIKTIVDANK
jgi:thioredoxin-related protein